MIAGTAFVLNATVAIVNNKPTPNNISPAPVKYTPMIGIVNSFIRPKIVNPTPMTVNTIDTITNARQIPAAVKNNVINRLKMTDINGIPTGIAKIHISIINAILEPLFVFVCSSLLFVEPLLLFPWVLLLFLALSSHELCTTLSFSIADPSMISYLGSRNASSS